MFRALSQSIKKLMRLVTSEPRAVATGQTLTSEGRSRLLKAHSQQPRVATVELLAGRYRSRF
jgi:hypothetical protein